MSTPTGSSTPAWSAGRPLRRAPGRTGADPADFVADVALARRDLMLRVHRHRLRAEDLEDCYSQATLELVQRARAGARFASAAHLANTIELKFLSRVNDRRRALAGRSPIEAALGQATTLEPPEGGAGELADPGPGVEEQVATRSDLRVLREIAADLTPDMQLVLAHQVGLGTECHAFCERFGWSPEKFRKVAQRARRRLLDLSNEHASGERCRRLEPDLLAYLSRVADQVQSQRVTLHLDNCLSCRGRAREIRADERAVLVLIPGGLEALSAGGTVGSAGVGATAAGGAVAWGGSGVLGAKLGVVAVCLVGLAGGGMAVCRLGPLGHLFAPHSVVHRVAAPHHRRVVRVRPDRGSVERSALPAENLVMPAAAIGAARPSSVVTATASVGSTVTPPVSPPRRAQREFGLAALLDNADSAAASLTAAATAASRTPGADARQRSRRARVRRHRRRRRSRPISAAVAGIEKSVVPTADGSPTAPASTREPTAAAPSASAHAGGEFGFEGN